MRRWLLSFFVLLLAVSYAPSWAAGPTRADCDSCRFDIYSLDQPFSTIGNWLFTRDDRPDNKNVDLDTSAWKLVKTPGPWKGVYDDKTNYNVGWYRGVFNFAPYLVGQEVVFLVDTYMAPTHVYLDGQEIFRRPGDINVDRYYSIQPIPVRFRITKPEHTVAIRVDTWIMTGIYQLPFELRRFDTHDTGSVFYQYQGAEIRLIAAAVAFSFGLFFLLVYSRTHYGLYLCAALTSLVISPFFVTPTDYLLRIFPPEPLFFLHYPGLIFGYFIYLSSQYFHKFTPRINWISGLLFASTSLVIASMVVYPNLDLFQAARSLHLLLLLTNALGSGYMFINGVIKRKPGSGILLTGMLIFLFCGINDFLLATGRIMSVGIMSMGVFAFLAALLYVACSIFANTFRENKHLVEDLRRLNDHLEELVADRTRELAVAVDRLGVANRDLSTSYEQLKVTKDELVRSEKLAALGSLVAGIAHELNTPLGNGLMAVTTMREKTDLLKQEIADKGPRRSTFESFIETVETANAITLRSLNRSAELVASFKQIAVDQTSSRRSEFHISDLFRDVQAALKPALKNSPYQLACEMAEDFELDSYPGPLSQVLVNLINNALVHAFEGRSEGAVRLVASMNAGDRILLTVTDNGVGIAEDHLSKIFDPFFTTKLGQGGSGLGLHIVHNIVTQVLGGALRVTTSLGNGTEFVVEIPRKAPIAATMT